MKKPVTLLVFSLFGAGAFAQTELKAVANTAETTDRKGAAKASAEKAELLKLEADRKSATQTAPAARKKTASN